MTLLSMFALKIEIFDREFRGLLGKIHDVYDGRSRGEMKLGYKYGVYIDFASFAVRMPSRYDRSWNFQ